MGFSNTGFTDLKRGDVEYLIPPQTASLLRLFAEANRCALGFLLNLSANPQDGRSVFSAVLFARLLENSQSAAKLAAIGARPAAFTLLRSVVEIFVLMKNNAERYDFLSEVYNSGMNEVRTLISEENLQPVSGQLTKAQHEVISEQRDTLEEFFSGEQTVRLRWKDLAERVGLATTYNLVYRLSCTHTHSSLSSLSQYFSVSDSGEPKMEFGPRFEDLDRCATSLIEFLIEAVVLAARVSSVAAPAWVDSVRMRLRTAINDIDSADPVN